MALIVLALLCGGVLWWAAQVRRVVGSIMTARALMVKPARYEVRRVPGAEAEQADPWQDEEGGEHL